MRPRSGSPRTFFAVTVAIGASVALPDWVHAQCCGGGVHGSGHASGGHGGTASTNRHGGHGSSANPHLTPFPYATSGLWNRSAHPPQHLPTGDFGPTASRLPYSWPVVGLGGLSKPVPFAEHRHPPVTTGPATSAPQPVHGFSGPRGPLVLRGESRSVSGTILRTLDMRVPCGSLSERADTVSALGRGLLPGAPNPLTNIASRGRSGWTLTGETAVTRLASHH